MVEAVGESSDGGLLAPPDTDGSVRRLLWINPVAVARHGRDALEEAVWARGYRLVDSLSDQRPVLIDKYRKAVAASTKPVAVMRCPLALRYVRSLHSVDWVTPNIYPLLIHSALELHAHHRPDGATTLTVTTPCVMLAELGNGLGLANTTFQDWDSFAAEQHLSLTARRLDASPVPPGLFDGLGVAVRQLTSRARIDAHFAAPAADEPDLVEMFYCTDGCHNSHESYEAA